MKAFISVKIMWSRPLACTLLATLSFAAVPGAQAPTGFPFTDEDLNYSINWPGGATLGEAHLHAKACWRKLEFELSLDAGVPGFAIKDSYHSDTVADYCSISFERSTSHGSRVVGERETDRSRARDRHSADHIEGRRQERHPGTCLR